MVKRTLVCTPDFITRQNLKQGLRQGLDIKGIADLEPRDIASWPWIKHSMLSNKRRLIAKNSSVNQQKQKSLELDFTNQITLDSVEAMTQFCLLGSGIATPPDFLVEQAIVDGSLVELLADWQVEDLPLYAV